MEVTQKYQTARHAANIIGVSYRLILKWINDGELQCYRIGENKMIRISDEQISRFLENHEIVKGDPLDNGEELDGEPEELEEPA